MGGGRPAERRFTVGGSGKSVARCYRAVLAYWKFESISFQRRVMQTIGSSGTERQVSAEPGPRFGRDSSPRRISVALASRDFGKTIGQRIRISRSDDESAVVN